MDLLLLLIIASASLAFFTIVFAQPQVESQLDSKESVAVV